MKKNSLMVGFLAILFLLPVLNETTEASFWDKIFGDRKQTTQLPPEPEPPVKSAGQKNQSLNLL